MSRIDAKPPHHIDSIDLSPLPRFSIDVPSSPLTLQTKQNEDMREAGSGWFAGWPSRISVT